MLTKLEEKILHFIGEYLRENAGRSPTLSEIGAGCGLKSVGTIHRYISSIEEKGFLQRARSGWRTLLAPNELPFKGIIAAGGPIAAVEQNESIDLTALLVQPDCFILKISGDSMIDMGIMDEDLIVVKPAQTARDGEIVVALIDNEDATLKEFKKINNGRQIELIPHNTDLSTQTYDAEQVQIQGILSSVVRSY